MPDFTPEEERVFQVAEELATLGRELQPRRLPDKPALALVVAVSARACTVFDAVLWLCTGSQFGPAEILNRVLFEDMASAHWIIANPDLALERIQQHEQLEDILWRDVAGHYPKMFGDITPTSPFEDRMADLQKVFGDFGQRHWTGLGMYALVQAIEDQWPEGRLRNELWMYWRIGQRRNSSQVHGGAGPYADAARHLFGGELSKNPGFVGADYVGGPLSSAIWIFGHILTLILDHVDGSRRAQFDEIWNRATEATVGLLRAVAAKRQPG